MSDPVAAVAAAPAAPAPAPVASAPAAPAAAPAPAATPAAAPAAAAPTAAAPAAAAPVHLLGGDPPAVEKPATEGAKAEAADATKEGEGKQGDDASKGEKPAGAPEKYEFAAPEGVQLNTDGIAKFEPIARELNLTQEQAQKLVSLQTELSQQFVAKQAETIAAAASQWAKDAAADKEFGGDKLAENLGIANAAMTKFASPELVQILKATGLSNHPEMVRAFYRAGKSLSPDSKVVTPAGSSDQGASALARLYPTMKQ